MGLEMVLNDLSLLPLAKDAYGARQRMHKLVDTIIAAVSLKVERVLRTDYNVNSIELAPGYLVAQWLNDAEVDRETRRYFRSLTTKAPYLKDVTNPKVQDMYELSAFFHEQNKASGLGAAFLLDVLAVSFHSHTIWEAHFVQLSQEYLQENNVIINQVVSVQHACSREHVFAHQTWIRKRTQINIESGTDLCAHSAVLYPNLRFCLSAFAQLQALPSGEIHLQQIRKHLLDLDTYCEKWHEASFSLQGVAGRITPESDATLRTYKKEHTFLCPDGQQRVFSWHCRVTPEPWRIYFFPLPQERLIIIGHVGNHLPTIKYH